MTIIKKCTCKHTGQDQLHGHQMRIFNLLDGNKEARCTVCHSKIKAD